MNPEIWGIPSRIAEDLRSQSSSQYGTPLDSYKVLGSICTRLFQRRALTVETDKLVAIGGIAAKMQSFLDDTYLAGLWRRHLANHLLWRCYDEGCSKPEQYVAPSWSWASVNGAIHGVSDIHFEDGRDILIDVLTAEVEHKGDNVFGPVKGGTICLQGKLFWMMANSEKFRCSGAVWVECLVSADIDVTMAIKTVNGARISPNHNDLYCLPVKDASAQHKCPILNGLLLEASGSVGDYRHIGVFSAFDKDVVDVVQAAFNILMLGLRILGRVLRR
jgi:hypothetical protein